MEIKELEKKLAAARKKIDAKESRGYTAASNPSVKVVVDMISGLAVGCFLGYFVDTAMGSAPLAMIVLTISGVFIGLYIFYKDYLRTLDKGNDKPNT